MNKKITRRVVLGGLIVTPFVLLSCRKNARKVGPENDYGEINIPLERIGFAFAKTQKGMPIPMGSCFPKSFHCVP